MEVRRVHATVCSSIALLLVLTPSGPSWGQDSDPQVRPHLELSIRPWLFTAGETQWSQNASGLDPRLGDPTSQLTYKDNDTQLLGFGANMHVTRRLSLQGEFAVSVDFDRGSLIDDDYLAGQRLFSRTSSDITGKGTWYVQANVGYRAAEFPDGRGHFDVLAGFQYWSTTYEATGFSRIVCDPSVISCNPPTSSLPAIKNTTHWITPLHVGGQLEYEVMRRVSANLRFTFSPVSIVFNEDIHYQRRDLQQDPSFSMWGLGLGASAEPSISIKLTRRLSLTGGYRVMWNRTYYGRWEGYPIGSAPVTTPLNELQTLRHGVIIGLTSSF
ncbi:MAG: omptin family outer membrane protease [Nitrospira sp.]|nr:omptin family outer membrane protease [Nitrospira sp.]